MLRTWRRAEVVTVAQRLENHDLHCTVSLLFPAGKRPDARAIDRLAREAGEFAISIDPGDGEEPHRWVELLANGLTFDLSGLAPGRKHDTVRYDHVFGLEKDLDTSALEAVTITPGPHLVSGGPMVPVIRCLACLAARLSQLEELVAVAWSPAGTCCAPGYFHDTVMRWIGGGAFPGLGLTALVPLANGGLQSNGLWLFTGQELRIDPQLVPDRAEGAKIALRLLHWLVENGRVDQSTALTGPSGEALLLEPLRDQAIVKAWRGVR